ncbi:hypothetical protein L2E82_10361 [Cichorium intybus]|uniref:Uncharacterized protein n=1 Tax=Cichorium intybus TaxID=13427 RepID=A0ACB9GBG0_CICIN|nr:hypothetical protein L2E82_10361 [Cichorium intybus]
MERLIKDPRVYLKIDAQLVDYKEKNGLFGYRADPSDDEEDDIDEALRGDGATKEEDGWAMGSRGGRRAIGEGSGSLSSRKRKSIQVNLIDEDDDVEVNLDGEDDYEDDMLIRV